MFVIELVYKVPLTEIDAHMKAHMAFLNKYYASGHFLVSGRKIPREGGIILATGRAAKRSKRSSRKTLFAAAVSRIFGSSSFARAKARRTCRSESAGDVAGARHSRGRWSSKMSSPSTIFPVGTKPSFALTRSDGALSGVTPEMKWVTPCEWFAQASIARATSVA